MDCTICRFSTAIDCGPSDEERARLARHYQEQARIPLLEKALGECLHQIAELRGEPTEAPEPQCVLDAKRLLGWTLA